MILIMQTEQISKLRERISPEKVQRTTLLAPEYGSTEYPAEPWGELQLSFINKMPTFWSYDGNVHIFVNFEKIKTLREALLLASTLS